MPPLIFFGSSFSQFAKRFYGILREQQKPSFSIRVPAHNLVQVLLLG